MPLTLTVIRATLLLAAALPLASPHALADGDRNARVPLKPLYVQECGVCHTAYPPAWLPAASWQRLTGQLSRHFGSDASLDAATLAELSGWLATHAATPGSRRGGDAPPEDRITRSAWFLREHREVPAATWRHPQVRSASQCAACHTRAAEGSFRERELQLPR